MTFTETKRNILLLLGLIMFFCSACIKNTKAKIDRVDFSDKPVAYPVLQDDLNEISGIAESRNAPGFIWAQQDSGNPPEIILLSDSGKYIRRIRVHKAGNRDWEDMLIGKGPDSNKHYVYIAEIGDNNAQFKESAIFRFPEPAFEGEAVLFPDKIRFVYPDGPRDGEAMLLDENTKDIFIITKRDYEARLYKISYPQDLKEINTAKFLGSFPFSGVVSAAVSNDQKEVIIKTYSTLYYWQKNPSESIETILTKSFANLAYITEPMGEAICFANRKKGFYTLSERKPGMRLYLNFYQQK